ncbi:MAG: hypothetical protein H0X40_01170 [Chthoniobacterales bacterium]|nr:hypothetical protein [Chthoniobacterales bacterium]
MLVDASRGDELFLWRWILPNEWAHLRKFATVEHRRQHARRMRYPDETISA